MPTREIATKKPTIRRKPASHYVRTKDGGLTALKLTRGLAIKLFCVECLGWETNPADCGHTVCSLYPYRGNTRASHHGDEGTVPKSDRRPVRGQIGAARGI